MWRLGSATGNVERGETGYEEKGREGRESNVLPSVRKGFLGLVTKRIEHVPHSEPAKVVLKSLNPEYDSYEHLAEEVRVVGRAVWVSRRL